MTDWVTIGSSLATAGGTLILAVATFSSVRSSSRMAELAERSLRTSLRPVLAPARAGDPTDKVRFVDGHWSHLEGGRASVEMVDDQIYLAMPLRNVGAGMAIIRAWVARGGQLTSREPFAAPADFRRQTRDLYVPPGDTGFWQGALRETSDPVHGQLADCITRHEPITVDLLYTDHEAGQPTISRFSLFPASDSVWLLSVTLHRPAPDAWH